MKYTLGVLLSILSLVSIGQIEDPVRWSFDSKQVTENTFDLLFTAAIEEHWHIYSNTLDPDKGPVPTTFDFTADKSYQLNKGIKEPKPINEYDKNFDMDLLYFDNEVTFVQRVKVLAESTTIKGELTYMTCDDSKCLPPEYVNFSFDLKKTEKQKEEKTKIIQEDKIKLSPSPETKEAELIIHENKSSGIKEPVKWSFEATKIGENEYELIISANIEKGWHVYSQDLERQDGPVATEVNFFNPDSNFTLNGKTIEEGDLIDEYDENFAMDLRFYTTDVTFKQKILTESATSIKGEVYFMVCDEKMCLPPEAVEFEISLNNSNSSLSSPEETAENEESNSTSKRSFWGIFFLSFISGFAALLTPCVFPMIPMTVSFFTKQSKTKSEGIRNAIFYGISIIVIYVLLGTVVTAVFGSEVLSEMATNFWFNIIFFVLLSVFAISFLGAFEIVLPSSWVNAADKGADKGGMIGIFFMAFTLALVSFSCTGPIVGTLIVEAAQVGGMMPIVGMFGFSLAIALPFGLFAAFPGWLNSLPQSGGWLNSVKVVLGFLELGLAMKFLSNADLVIDAGWVTREVFLAFWIVISAMLGFYLIGKIRLPHDSAIEKLPVSRVLLAVITFTFTIYLIPGMWGAPLKLIAGFPPPMTYAEAPFGSFAARGGASSGGTHIEGMHQGPQNIQVFYDWDEGLKYAQSVNKPLFVDFTGKACANCRKMEEKVWGEPGIIDVLRNDVVIVSLYVDFEEPLPADEVKEVMIGTRKKTLKSVGDKWMYKQVVRYKTNTQPYYTMLGPNGEDLANGSADFDRHRKPEDFKVWLLKGLDLYKKAK